jgi:hypothetical protein
VQLMFPHSQSNNRIKIGCVTQWIDAFYSAWIWASMQSTQTGNSKGIRINYIEIGLCNRASLIKFFNWTMHQQQDFTKWGIWSQSTYLNKKGPSLSSLSIAAIDLIIFSWGTISWSMTDVTTRAKSKHAFHKISIVRQLSQNDITNNT